MNWQRLLPIYLFLALRWEVPIMRPGPNWGHLALKIYIIYTIPQTIQV